MLYYATGIPYILKSVPPFAEFLRSAVMEAPPFTPLLTNPVTVILAGFGLYRLWRRPDLQPRSLARLGQSDGISPSRMAEMLEVDKAGPKVRC